MNSAFAGCAEGDGSPQRPYCQISRTLERPPGPLAVLVAAADYPEAVRVARRELWILGAEGARRARTVPPEAGAGLRVGAGAELTLAGVQIGPVAGVGLAIDGAKVQVEDVLIQDVTNTGELMGHGLVAAGRAQVSVVGLAVERVAGIYIAGEGGEVSQTVVSGVAQVGVAAVKGAVDLSCVALSAGLSCVMNAEGGAVRWSPPEGADCPQAISEDRPRAPRPPDVILPP